MSFVNKVVLITGASSGIGAATAISFAKEGANLAIVGRNEKKLKTVAEQCKKNGVTPLVIIAELANEDDVKRIMKETIDKYKKLDVLVNNAGLGTPGSILNGTILATYDKIMSVNLRAVIQLTTLAAPYLVESKGNIVNISSVAAKMAQSVGSFAYNVSKAGLNHFTRGAALELSTAGVRVNGISPGPVRTDIFENSESNITVDSFTPRMPLKRVSEPDEIADLVLYLASEKAKGITGSDFVSDNGALLTEFIK